MKALVFSAGGMFGAWQAGAWEVLAPIFQPDIIIGASIGSLNGWVAASTTDPEALTRLWTDASRFEPLKLRPGLSPVRGGSGGLLFGKLVSSLWEEYRPKLPVGVVCTPVPRLRPVLFRDADITWRHLAASCALPFILPAQHLPDGRWYYDGGLLGPLPLWAAVEAGATEILAVHVLPPLPFVLKVTTGLLRLVSGHHPKIPAGVSVVRVGPERHLGSLRESVEWREDNIHRWIEEGRRVAEQRREAVLQMSASEK